MKERQRWRPEEDTLLQAYVKQYGPKDFHLLSIRMNKPLNRDAKSCLERWKNYLKPGIKKESLTEEEQRLVIQLQAKHGNKWKKIASEVPGRTAKRLGKWWEVFKEKKQREENNKVVKEIGNSIDEGKYDRILENFAEKLVQERAMSASNVPSQGGQSVIPPWLASSSKVGPLESPSVTLTLSPSPASNAPWLHQGNNNYIVNNNNIPVGENSMVSEICECVKELEEGHRALTAHKKEAAWRLKRVELQLESEKASRRREVVEETEAKVAALREEQRACLDRIEMEYREQLAGLRREAEVKEQKLAEQWAAKHEVLSKFVKRMGR